MSSLTYWEREKRASSSSSVVEGSGGSDGVILSLQLVGSGIYDVAYTLPVSIGDNSKTHLLQVDTGSSDLWVASSSCSTSSCGAVGGNNLYDPSDATPTGYDFNITYLEGYVSGPIVWDRVNIGGYSIENQALAAATVVNQEPLSSNFGGILGLALPLNSIIASLVHTVTGNSPDGAAWASNLFSMTPVSFSPSAHFLSLSLSRPGSDTIPSLLGIGRHPNSMVSDPGKIHYSTLVSERNGALYWKVGVRAITVYVNGTARQIEIGRSSSGMVFPTALLDSGIPLILTTSNIANAIYGALGIGPAADGHYYVPCTTPLNMTITLDNRPEIPLHPLDLTAEPQDNNRAQYCVGLIQADDAQLANPSSGIGDMILGVPFLRNTYTVMAYTTPYENGSFPDPATLPSDLVIPNLGLLSLTDPSVALDEFKTVRLLNQPISSGNHHNGDAGPTTVGPKKLSIGVIVLIALIGFFSLCCALFGLRWYLLKRKFRKDGAGLDLENKTAGTRGDSESSIIKGGPDKASVYAALKASRSFEEERLKSMEAYEEYASGGNGDGTAIEARPDDPPRPRERVASERTVSSGRTVVEKASPASELGYGVGVGIGGKDVMKDSFGSRWSMAEEMFARHSVRMSHRSNSMGSTSQTQSHDRNASLFVPLLSSPHHHRRSQSIDTDRVVSPIASPTTAMFGSEAGPVEENTSSRHIPSAVSDLEKVEEREMPGPESGPVEGNEDSGRAPESVPNLGELGYRHSHPDSDDGGGGGGGTLGSTGSMAGIGTAAVARRRIESLSFPRESFFSTTSSMVIASATGEEHRHPPPAVDSEEAEPPTPPPRDGAVRFPSPAFIPSGTRKPGDCARPASTSMLDDFDPYAEYPLR